ncbi:MAG: hypothetical protein M3122_06610 [Actinomycetota bacterium]|nr:hypothetical protein [Actinomycetota bacterium]
MKVLIAEDDAISRTILKKSVEKFGHECLWWPRTVCKPGSFTRACLR